LQAALEKAGYQIVSQKMIVYRPERRNVATGMVAIILTLMEKVSSFFPNGPFRMLMIAKPIQNQEMHNLS